MKKRNPPTGVRTKTIGIIPVKNTSDSICVLLLAIAIANYLTGVNRKKVALINMADPDFLLNLAWYHNLNISPDDKYFNLYGVRYYLRYNEKYISEIIGNVMDYIIFIGKGPFTSNVTLFDKTQLKLVAGSLDPWELKYYADFLKRMAPLYSGKDNWVFLAQYFSEKDKKHMEKNFKVSIQKLPFDLDPFKIKRSAFPFFANILS